MRSLVWLACGLMLLAAAGCGDSDDDGDVDLGYPDIPGLVVFYDFDGDLENAVGDIHHGTKDGEAEYVADRWATSSSAILADGEPVVVADHADLDITGSVTLAAWTRPEVSDRAYTCVVDKDYSTGYSFGMHGGVAADTTHLTAFISNTGFTTVDVVPFATGMWSHVVFTYDEGAEQGKFYVNGALVVTIDAAVVIGTNDESLRIGESKYGDTYRGGIDQVAVFNRAITAQEVAELYAYE